MTSTELLDKVDWVRMEEVNVCGLFCIRIQVTPHDTYCPIKAALGGTNSAACETAMNHGMTNADAQLIMAAADDCLDDPDARALRADMLARMRKAKAS